ncbi:unnamed protein product [Oppiella nova]|uniref:Protein bicaudal C homolog 1 KH-like domain-containing protein n=1 Tax=Oppiella nova TaxID=334625 RepID=A0A7R9M2C9_9ACAR|nr:unnamed protein product [Oppiella nova]CAG2169471.1 unnamed protein product [Oppiella nova]
MADTNPTTSPPPQPTANNNNNNNYNRLLLDTIQRVIGRPVCPETASQLIQQFINIDPNLVNQRVRNLWSTYGGVGPTDIRDIWQGANSPLWNLWNAAKEKVDLQMDVSSEDRLFLNNGGQRDLNSIMSTNGTQIKLNLSPAVGHSDSSPVVVSGPPDGVLNTYLAIRQLLPITVWFHLHLNSSLSSIILDPSSKPLQDIQKQYEMAICVVPSQSPVITPTPLNHISVYIRTNKGKDDKLQAGIEALREFIESNNFGQFERSVQTKIDLPSHRPEIVGRTYSLLDPIANKTATQITVQRSATNLMSNTSSNTLSISGANFSSISTARTEISDRFVVELDFEVNAKDSQVLENFGRELERMGEQFAVHILMKPGADINRKIVIVRGTDREVRNLFDVRKHIMDLVKCPTSQPFQSLNNNNYH